MGTIGVEFQLSHAIDDRLTRKRRGGRGVNAIEFEQRTNEKCDRSAPRSPWV